MKVLVLGKDGQVGWHLQKEMPRATFWGRQELDLSNSNLIKPAIFASKPDCIINAAAYTAVDKAESEPDIARAINVLAVRELAKAARDLGIPLVHISTDYVFSGRAQTPYKEDDPVGPESVYGKTKLEGELAVREICEHYWIIRTSWVFSEHGNNFVKTILRLGKERDNLNIVADQTGQPTYAGDIATLISHLIEKLKLQKALAWGTYHFSCKGEVSWYGFAQAIVEQAEKSGMFSRKPVLIPITSEEYPLPAPRPRNSCLHTGKLEQWYEEDIPDWKFGLARLTAAVGKAN